MSSEAVWRIGAAALAIFGLGLYARVSARALAVQAGAPDVAERFAQRQGRLGRIGGLAFGLLLLAGPAWLPLTVPLLVVAAVAGSYPVRRALFGETWTMGAYLSHSVRLSLALAGYALAIAAAPALVAAAGSGIGAAAVAALVLIGWGYARSALVRRLLRLRPFSREDLRPRLAEIAAKSRVPMPRLLELPVDGGRMANAFALPSYRTPAVAFTTPLLSDLAPEETAAIFAHEMAHLEHFDRPRLSRQGFAIVLIALIAAYAVPFAALAAPSAPRIVAWAWPLLVLVSVSAARRRHQAHEADSDRRAVELCGDAEALARALTKLYEAARVPRRQDARREAAATHPSLARRLAALRGENATGLAAEELFEGARPGETVLFDAESVHFRRGASVRSHAYAELTELRLRPDVFTGASLVARRRGARFSATRFRVVAADVPRLQRTLDAVDARLAPLPRPREAAPVALVGRLTAGVALAAAILPGTPGIVAVPALVALVRPEAVPLFACGVMALAGLAFGVGGSGGAFVGETEGRAILAIATVIGLLALVVAFRRLRSGEDARRRALVPTAVLLGLALVASAAVAAAAWRAGAPLGRSSTPVIALGLVAAFGIQRGRRARLAAAGFAVLGLVGLVPLPAPRDAFASARGTAVVAGRLLELRRAEVPIAPSLLRVCEDGSAVLAGTGYDDDGEEDGRMLLVPFTSPPAELRAADAVFLDGERFVLLAFGPEGSALEERARSAPDRVVRRVGVPPLVSPRLAAAAGVAVYSGVDAGTRELVRISDRTTRWPPAPGGGIAWVSSMASASGDEALCVVPRDHSRWLAAAGARVGSDLVRLRTGTRLGSSARVVQIYPAPDGFVCLETRAPLAHLSRVADGRISSPVAVPGPIHAPSTAAGGRFACLAGGRDLYIADLPKGTVKRFAVPPGALAVALARDAVAVAYAAERGARVVVYRAE